MPASDPVPAVVGTSASAFCLPDGRAQPEPVQRDRGRQVFHGNGLATLHLVSVLTGYALGKAQRVIAAIRQAG